MLPRRAAAIVSLTAPPLPGVHCTSADAEERCTPGSERMLLTTLVLMLLLPAALQAEKVAASENVTQNCRVPDGGGGEGRQ